MVQDTPMANDHSDTHIFPWICVFLLRSSRCLVSHFNTMSITSVNTQTDVFENTKKKLLRVSSSFHSSRCVEGRRIKKMCVLFLLSVSVQNRNWMPAGVSHCRLTEIYSRHIIVIVAHVVNLSLCDVHATHAIGRRRLRWVDIFLSSSLSSTSSLCRISHVNGWQTRCVDILKWTTDLKMCRRLENASNSMLLWVSCWMIIDMTNVKKKRKIISNYQHFTSLWRGWTTSLILELHSSLISFTSHVSAWGPMTKGGVFQHTEQKDTTNHHRMYWEFSRAFSLLFLCDSWQLLWCNWGAEKRLKRPKETNKQNEKSRMSLIIRLMMLSMFMKLSNSSVNMTQ